MKNNNAQHYFLDTTLFNVFNRTFEPCNASIQGKILKKLEN